MAFDQIILKDGTSKIIEVLIRDSTTGQGKTGVAAASVTARYIREGASAGVSITMSGGALGVYSSGGWTEIDSTNQRGLYQFGIPNAAIATGTDAVTLSFQISSAIDKAVRIILINADLRNADNLGLSYLDVAVSSRSVYAGADTSGTTVLLSRITSDRATNLDYLDVAVSSRSVYAGADTTILGPCETNIGKSPPIIPQTTLYSLPPIPQSTVRIPKVLEG